MDYNNNNGVFVNDSMVIPIFVNEKRCIFAGKSKGIIQIFVNVQIHHKNKTRTEQSTTFFSSL